MKGAKTLNKCSKDMKVLPTTHTVKLYQHFTISIQGPSQSEALMHDGTFGLGLGTKLYTFNGTD